MWSSFCEIKDEHSENCLDIIRPYRYSKIHFYSSNILHNYGLLSPGKPIWTRLLCRIFRRFQHTIMSPDQSRHRIRSSRSSFSVWSSWEPMVPISSSSLSFPHRCCLLTLFDTHFSSLSVSIDTTRRKIVLNKQTPLFLTHSRYFIRINGED